MKALPPYAVRRAWLFDREIIKATWAILDQAAISLLNFSLNFSLARYASPDAYGIFTVAFSLLLLVYSFPQVSLTLDPLIILGGKKEQAEQIVYVRQTLLLNILISFLSVWILLLAALSFGAFGKTFYARAALLASIPLTFMNLRFFLRCFYIMRGDFFKACVNDASVLLVSALGIAGLVLWKLINDWTVIILLAISEATGPLLFLTARRMKIRQVVASSLSNFNPRLAFWEWSGIRENWNYGKWLLLANGASYAYQNVQFLLLPLFVPLASLAGYRACYLLAQPIYLFTTGLEAFAWSRGTEVMRSSGIAELQNFLTKMGGMVSALILLYAFFVGVEAPLLVEIIYAGKFAEFSSLLWFFLIAALFGFWGKLLGTGFRALGMTKCLSSSILWAGSVGVIAFLVLTKAFDVAGAAASYLLASVVSIMILAGYWLKEVK